MKQMNLIGLIRQKAENCEYLAGLAAKNTSVPAEILDGVKSPEATVKYKCIKILRILSVETPAALYPCFGFFAELLDGKNNILKWNAIDIISNLTAVDLEDRFGAMFAKYYSLLEEGSLITAAHVVESSPVIIKYKPEMENRITTTLFSIEKIPLPTEECRDILRGKLILAFSRYVDTSQNKAGMLEYAGWVVSRKQIRPAT